MERLGTRKTYLDALRLLACLGVIYNHVAGRSMRLFSGASGAAALFGFFVSKSAVGVFLLISGAVLLGRCDSYRKSLMRVMRVALALCLFSLLYYTRQCIWEGEAFSLLEFLLYFVKGEANAAYWYLFAYLGVLLALPFLQRLSLRMERRDYRYFILWALLCCGTAPTVAAIWPELTMHQSFTPLLFSVPYGLTMLGRYADTQIPMNGRRAAVLAVSALLLTAVPTVCTLCDGSLFAALDNYYLPFATCTAACAFLTVKWLDTRVPWNARVRAAISGAGRLTFCMYLISDLLIEKLQFVREALVPTFRTNGAGLIYTLLIFIVCMLLSAGLTRIPGLRKIL